MAESARILVVDDEPSITDFIALGLRHEGFDVRTAPDGRAALRVVDEFKPHLAVLDLMMPRLRIRDEVWGYNFFGDENNVEVYVRYLRQKLGDTGHERIQTVRGVGYRLRATTGTTGTDSDTPAEG